MKLPNQIMKIMELVHRTPNHYWITIMKIFSNHGWFLLKTINESWLGEFLRNLNSYLDIASNIILCYHAFSDSFKTLLEKLR